jgi:hypothetical protein
MSLASFQQRPVQALWRTRRSDGWVHAEIWIPIGWELRVLWNGDLVWSRGNADLAEAHREADEAKIRIERAGRESLG